MHHIGDFVLYLVAQMNKRPAECCYNCVKFLQEPWTCWGKCEITNEDTYWHEVCDKFEKNTTGDLKYTE